MKKLLNKDNIRLLINFIALIIITLFYLLSPLLNNVFQSWMIISVNSVVLVLLATQIVLTLLKLDKVKGIIKIINEYIQVFLVAIVLVQFIFTFVMFPATVSQNSMMPTLSPDDKLVIQCANEFENNDIIVFEYNEEIQ